ncbi:Alpha/Beta hydrolase fold [Rhypophila sp. PSN 637]
MAAETTIHVPHLGGIDVSYRLSSQFEPSKPTLVLVNSMCTTSSLYDLQFSSARLTQAVNLLAIEPLGHGATALSSGSPNSDEGHGPDRHFTYWDSATMSLQVMEALSISAAFCLGTSQGGWIVMRMALLAPDRVLGVLPLGTSMDCESADSREKGCWDPQTSLRPFLESWTSDTATPDFAVSEVWCGMVASLGFGDSVGPETIEFWKKTVKDVYRGDAGRMKLRMALICLLERDGLLFRVGDVRCPVYWLQGNQDPVFGTIVPEEQIKLFTSSVEARLDFVKGGGHYLNATSPVEVEEAVLEMVSKYALRSGRA